MEDRRQHRSADPICALTMQLDAVRTQAQLRMIVVADGSGLLLAASGDPEECEEVAALAPLGEQQRSSGVTTLRIASGSLYLCADGPNIDSAEHEAWLQKTAQGVERILALAA